MKPYKLKDAGNAAYPILPVARWVGFGALDDGREIEVWVDGIALQLLEPSSQGADHTNALEKHRSRVFAIAAEKYEDYGVEPDGRVYVKALDVVRDVARSPQR